jgi:hypothetical protein
MTQRARYALVAACLLIVGCNQILDLSPTKLGMKPPPACPSIGTPPHFDGLVRQALRQDCAGYTESTATGRALATCRADVAATPSPAEGPIGGLLVPIALATGDPADSIVWGPVLAPEGDEALVVVSNTPGQLKVGTFARSGATWTWLGYGTEGATTLANISPPSRRPNRHVLYDANTALHEAAQDAGGTWQEVAAPRSDFVVGAARPYLSPDGLRLLAQVQRPTGGFDLAYADRPAIDSAFSAPTLLAEVPPEPDMFMTEDCARIYFSGLDNVLYEQQP